ncbi:MAG: tyrosine-type recombinase/integrase [Planctomycetota bacterium]
MWFVFRHISTKTTATGEKVRIKSKKWYIRYRDADGKLVTKPGYTDKDATRQLAARLERESAQEKEGLSSCRSAKKKSLAELLEDYISHLYSKNDSQKHAKATENGIKRILEACGFNQIRDLERGKLEQHLRSLRGDAENKGISHRQSNWYLTTFKGFLRWLVSEGRMSPSSILYIRGLNPKEDVRRKRRTITQEEFTRLLRSAMEGPEFRGLSGSDRALLYITASLTGLRSGELASLSAKSMKLDATPPFLVVEAAYSKRRREDRIPLREDLATLLKDFAKGKSARLWPGTWHERSGDMIREDLERAGIAYESDDGYLDFHALRHSFVTGLAVAGVHPKMAQVLARHSTIDLTMNVYTHIQREAEAEALKGLPPLPSLPLR